MNDYRLPAVFFNILSLVLWTHLGCTPGPRESSPFPYDLLIQNGTVIDGSGADRFQADVALRADRIFHDLYGKRLAFAQQFTNAGCGRIRIGIVRRAVGEREFSSTQSRGP